MLVTEVTRQELRWRRSERDMKANGYECLGGPWDVFHGNRPFHKLVEAVIDEGGRHIWVKCEQAKAPKRYNPK